MSLTCSLLALSVGCKRETPVSDAQSSEAPAVLPEKSLGDKDWKKQIIGSWVSSSVPPSASPDDNCATDTNFDFAADGSFATSSDQGFWRLNGRMLVVTIVSSNPDGDIGPPMGKRAKPIVIRSQLVSYSDPTLTAVTEGEKEYWYRCPKGTDADPA